jgi:hypothetical protein
VEPDLVIYARGIKLEGVKGSDPVAIEVAAIGLAYDRDLKANLYGATASTNCG